MNIKKDLNNRFQTCKKCNIRKNILFFEYKKYNDSYRGICKECNNEKDRLKSFIRKNKQKEYNDLLDRNLQKCTFCNIIKDLNEFNNDKHSPSGKTRKCTICIRAIDGRSDNREKAYFRQIYNSYGLSKEEYITLYNYCDGKCMICDREAGYTKKTKLHIDHDHITGKVRGLLCQYCNLGLGTFKDNKENLYKAIKYLENNGN